MKHSTLQPICRKFMCGWGVTNQFDDGVWDQTWSSSWRKYLCILTSRLGDSGDIGSKSRRSELRERNGGDLMMREEGCWCIDIWLVMKTSRSRRRRRLEQSVKWWWWVLEPSGLSAIYYNNKIRAAYFQGSILPNRHC